MGRVSRRIDWDKVVQMHRQGFTDNEIASEVGARDPRYIRELLRRLLSKEELSQTTIDRGKIKALRNAGWTISAIAFEMQLPAKQIKEVLNEI